VGVDNSKCIDSLLLSIKIFVTKLFDKCIVLCLSYSIFFDKFIALKINFSIIINKLISKDFYAMLLSIQIFVTINVSFFASPIPYFAINSSH
jgi:hypothetical protein